MSIQRYLAEDAYLSRNDGPVHPDDLVLYTDHLAALRACEARVREDEHIRTLDYVQTGNTVMNVFGTYYGQGYAAGVQAARDAVAGLPVTTYAHKANGVGLLSDMVDRDDALAAIDVLRSEA